MSLTLRSLPTLLTDCVLVGHARKYYQHLQGHSDPRMWRGLEAVIRETNAFPGVQAWWRLHTHWFDEEFAKFINQQQETAKPPRLYREENPDR